MMKRRDVLKAALIGAGASVLPARLDAVGVETLTAAPARRRLLPPEYPETPLWLYNGSTPGPEIRVRQGERIERRLVNDLPQPTAVHWHGIRIENAMDGVPGLTQEAVPPGGSFDYSFVAPDAGTFWYHSHDNSSEQVARGLHGPLIVTEEETPDVDREIVLVLDDWRLTPEGALAEPFDSPMDRSHAGRVGFFPTTNGRDDWRDEVRPGARLRLRLINAANARIFELGFAGLDGWVAALDGMPLAAPDRLGDTLTLAPAQRADLIVDVVREAGEEAFIISIERGESFAQATFGVAGQPAGRRDVPAPLPPNAAAEPDLAGARPVSLLMEGGAMGRMTTAILDGEQADMRELMRSNMFWALNGVIGRTDTPLFEAARGESVRIGIANDTAFAHGMHLHGHHFREIEPDGSLGPLRDTTLLAAGAVREIALNASNPGDWLLHCHMLAHAASGMTTWFRVA